MQLLIRIIKFFLVILIKIYQWTFSLVIPSSCRFYPSCSQYAVDSIEKLGIMRGLWFAAKRILKCHPFHPGGYDPVPDCDCHKSN
ncbi:membrane protein insertion efficiency factor YidD [bacterium]|nr:membrane protein insertion efficiency factor YidD [bacterium]